MEKKLMFQQIHHKIALIAGVLVVSLSVAYLAIAWTEPTATPPGDNVPAPINVGNSYQMKTGPLTISNQFITTTSTLLATLDGSVGIGTTTPGLGHSAPAEVGLDVSNQIITGVKTPIDPSDAVPMSYVDAQAGGGVIYYTSCRSCGSGSCNTAPLCTPNPCASGYQNLGVHTVWTELINNTTCKWRGGTQPYCEVGGYVSYQCCRIGEAVRWCVRY